MREKCARAMVEWLRGSLNVERPIRSLKMRELMLLADNVMITWVIEESRRPDDPPPDPNAWEEFLL